MNRKERLVVVGNGMAGARFVEELILRGGSERFDIVMFGDEPYGNYNRILLSGVLSKTHGAADIFLNPLAWYKDNGVTLHAGSRVRHIDRTQKLVTADGGIVEPYDRLVIATGSSAFLPPIPNLRSPSGELLDGAYVFRTLDDCQSISEKARASRTAIVIGGGLLGLEAARGLVEFGLRVHVVHLAEHVMEVQLDSASSAMLRQALEKLGVVLHVSKKTTAVRGETAFEGIDFADGGSLDGDLLVVAAGIRPNADIARRAGLDVARGIVVDDGLRTSDGAIWAVGECAEHRGMLYGLVAPLWEQARVLAERFTQVHPSSTYVGSKVATKLKVMGVDLAVLGEKEAASEHDEVLTYSEPKRGIYKKVILRENRVVGAILLGDTAAAPALLQAFDRETEVSDVRSEILFPSQSTSQGLGGVEALPDDAQICNCNGIRKGEILGAVREGKRTLQTLCKATRAGTGCGACKGQVEALLVHALDGVVPDDPSIHYYVPGIPLRKQELVARVRERGLRSVSAVIQDVEGSAEDATTKMGLASLLKTLWGKEYDDERDARFINDRVHANIQKDATFSVIPRIYGGVTSAAELRRIADVADKYDVPMVKITGGQRIDLLGIRKDQLPDVWRDLGMPSGHAYAKSFRTCKTCVGSEFCRYGVGDSTGLGIAIERKFQGLESPAKMKLATAGCPRNCSEATTKDVGVVAIEGGRWEIYVGGGAGSRVRKGDLLTTVASQEQVLTIAGRFMQFYRESARYLERTYDFVERLGIDEVRAIVVADRDGLAASLDAAIEAATVAFVDPWTEAFKPHHPSQFTTVVNTENGESRTRHLPVLQPRNDMSEARPVRLAAVAGGAGGE